MVPTLKAVEFEVEKLIVLVHARPVLYNYNLKEYHNKDITEKMWEEVAAEMCVPVAECRIKWHSLRNAYARHLREEKKTLSCRSAVLKKKIWYLADILEFLRNYIGQSRKMNCSLQTDCNARQYDDSEIVQDDNIPQETPIEDELHESSQNSSNIDYTNGQGALTPPQRLRMPYSSTKQKSKKRKITRPQANPMEKLVGPMIEYLKARSQPQQYNGNAHLDFFKSIISDMVKLDERRQRKFKEDILIKLNRYLDEQDHERCTYLSMPCSSLTQSQTSSYSNSSLSEVPSPSLSPSHRQVTTNSRQSHPLQCPQLP